MQVTPTTPARALRRQFLLAPPGSPTIAGLPVRMSLSNGLVLQADPELDIARVLDNTNECVGYLLGVAIDPVKRHRYRETIPLDASPDEFESIDAFVEASIYGFSGSFIFLLDQAGHRRAYLDACGSLSAVYDSAATIFASTTSAFLSRQAYADRFRSDLHTRLDILGEGWFPAGLTAHRGVERLLVNHYLNLDSWQPTRHWPTSIPEMTEDPAAACQEIGNIARGVIDACIADGPTVLALTGGNETRLLLAIMGEDAGSLDFATVVSTKTRRDVVIAKRLVDRFGLRQVQLPLQLADDRAALDWHARAGHCVGDVNMRSHPSVQPLARYKYFIGGLGGEIGRGFFWRATDTKEQPVTAARIVSAFGMPSHPDVTKAVVTWRDKAPQLDAFSMLDLAYIELRMGCWAFPQSYCADHVQDVHPLIGRKTFSLMLSLPPEWRRSNRLITETVKIFQSDLLSIPINQYGDYRDYTDKIIRMINNPKAVLKKLRKLRGGFLTS